MLKIYTTIMVVLHQNTLCMYTLIVEVTTVILRTIRVEQLLSGEIFTTEELLRAKEHMSLAAEEANKAALNSLVWNDYTWAKCWFSVPLPFSFLSPFFFIPFSLHLIFSSCYLSFFSCSLCSQFFHTLIHAMCSWTLTHTCMYACTCAHTHDLRLLLVQSLLILLQERWLPKHIHYPATSILSGMQ